MKNGTIYSTIYKSYKQVLFYTAVLFSSSG